MTRVTVLTGGVGGAKLVLGLINVVPAADVTAIVNTGDDFTHLGLHISPDIDTLLYTLSGTSNAAQGWGREGETWGFMKTLRALGGEDWFLLGDHDLALHVARSHRLRQGEMLSRITHDFATAWGIGARVLPMSDAPVATWIDTDEGALAFQRYFVARRCQPRVAAVTYRGAADAAAAPGVTDAIRAADCILIAPSNPYLSVAPILAVPEIASALRDATAPIVAVSPLVAGDAVKGPTAKIMRELGITPDNDAIARFYEGCLDGLVIHQDDRAPADVPVARTSTLMVTLEDRRRVAQVALDLAARVRRP